MIIEVKQKRENIMKSKNNIEATLICFGFRFFFYLRHVYTCSYLPSQPPQRERGRENKEGREDGKTEKKRG